MQFIAIEGNIGAGKTSLAEMIGERFGARVILEQFSENPFLPGFYRDPDRYAFPLELSFLAARYNQLKGELPEPELFTPLTVADYYFAKTLIFASNTLSGHEYKLFRQLFEIMNSSLPVPDLYVYLHRDPLVLLENIGKRGRHYEQGIKYDYLERIQNSYFDFMKQKREVIFLLIDLGDSDFVSDRDVFDEIARLIFAGNHTSGINRVVL